MSVHNCRWKEGWHQTQDIHIWGCRRLSCMVESRRKHLAAKVLIWKRTMLLSFVCAQKGSDIRRAARIKDVFLQRIVRRLHLRFSLLGRWREPTSFPRTTKTTTRTPTKEKRNACNGATSQSNREGTILPFFIFDFLLCIWENSWCWLVSEPVRFVSSCFCDIGLSEMAFSSTHTCVTRHPIVCGDVELNRQTFQLTSSMFLNMCLPQ